MTSVLNTETLIKTAPEAAELGRFFVPPHDELQLFPTGALQFEGQTHKDIRQCIADQEPIIKAAQAALGKLRKAQILIETDALLSGVVDPGVLEEAKLDSIDQGTVWRSCTDRITHTIASRFPNQVLADPLFDTEEAVHITSEHTIYRIDSGLNVWSFASYGDQMEMNAGIKIATEEMWETLLFNMSVAAVMSPSQRHS